MPLFPKTIDKTEGSGRSPDSGHLQRLPVQSTVANGLQTFGPIQLRVQYRHRTGFPFHPPPRTEGGNQIRRKERGIWENGGGKEFWSIQS